MQRDFGVELDPATEVNHCIGSKTALAMLPAAFINPGDVTLMTVPGYPVAGTHTKYYGGEVHRLPLLAENDFFPDLDAIPADVRKRAKLLVHQLSQQPDRQGGHARFLPAGDRLRPHQRDRRRAGRGPHHAHATKGEPLSFLSVAGAKDVGVEVHSMSKGFHMIGWRLGWVCGHEDRAGLCRREGQQRLGPVHGHPEGGRARPWTIRRSATAIREKYRRRLQEAGRTL